MNLFAKEFLSFVDASPSPFHVCKTASNLLEQAGFTRLHEDTPWKEALTPGKQHKELVVPLRHQTRLAAFFGQAREKLYFG